MTYKSAYTYWFACRRELHGVIKLRLDSLLHPALPHGPARVRLALNERLLFRNSRACASPRMTWTVTTCLSNNDHNISAYHKNRATLQIIAFFPCPKILTFALISLFVFKYLLGNMKSI